MHKTKILLTILSLSFVTVDVSAQLPEPTISPVLSTLIRGQKFDLILPQVMRDNGIDMWIQVMRGENPLRFELGDHDGVYVFSDRGGDRVERAVFVLYIKQPR